MWLRFYDAQGALIPSKAEWEAQERAAKERERQAKEQERQAKEAALRQAEQEREAKEAALQELARLKAQLRALEHAEDEA